MDFALLMVPTNGPYDVVIHQIAHVVQLCDVSQGKTVTQTPQSHLYESFGYVKKSQIWWLELELRLLGPHWLMCANESYKGLK